MKKPVLLTLLLSIIVSMVRAQSGELTVHSGDKGLYLDHVVAAKEGLYSIGRLYNINPKHIAAYNKIDLNAGINIDQVIHIPLTDTNFNQKTAKGTPVYYTVTTGDGLYKISNQHRKVPVSKLKEWNKLTGENVNDGSKLVVGYLVSKEMETYVKTHPMVKETKPEPVIAKTEPVETPAVAPVKQQPTNPDPIASTPKPTVKEEPRKQEAPVTQTQNANPSQGYFKINYDQQAKSNKEMTVSSGIFKTSSGWQDAKYYLLVDGVASGTIVRLENPQNNRTVYAKVLGQMNGIRQNQGLDVRISNAAASSLGINDTERFSVKMSY